MPRVLSQNNVSHREVYGSPSSEWPPAFIDSNRPEYERENKQLRAHGYCVFNYPEPVAVYIYAVIEAGGDTLKRGY